MSVCVCVRGVCGVCTEWAYVWCVIFACVSLRQELTQSCVALVHWTLPVIGLLRVKLKLILLSALSELTTCLSMKVQYF